MGLQCTGQRGRQLWRLAEGSSRKLVFAQCRDGLTTEISDLCSQCAVKLPGQPVIVSQGGLISECCTEPVSVVRLSPTSPGARQKSWLHELKQLSLLSDQQPRCHDDLSRPSSSVPNTSSPNGCVLRPARLRPLQPNPTPLRTTPSSPPHTPSHHRNSQFNGLVQNGCLQTLTKLRPPSPAPHHSSSTCTRTVLTFIVLVSLSGNVLLLWLLLTQNNVPPISLFSIS